MRFATSCSFAAALSWALASTTAASAQGVTQVGTIDVPGQKLAAFDVSTVADGTYYLADRSNKAVDMFDVASHAFKGRVEGFAGPSDSNDTAGPNGVLALPKLGQVWAGDGNSTVKVIDLRTRAVVATIPTGGKARADEMSADAAGSTVLVTNDADDPVFVSLISTAPDHKVLARIEFPDASNGIEQSVWDAATGMFYISVPEVGKDKTKGEIAVIDPKAGKVVRTVPLDRCESAGMVEGPKGTFLVGCSEDAAEAGFAPTSLLVDVAGGKVVKTFTEVGGSDEVAYDPTAKTYYLAARGMTGGAVLGVIDASRNAWVANLPVAKNTKSVAADPATSQVFVPQTPSPVCPNGCIAVFGPAS